jgi:ethanolamine transporter EutH
MKNATRESAQARQDHLSNSGLSQTACGGRVGGESRFSDPVRVCLVSTTFSPTQPYLAIGVIAGVSVLSFGFLSGRWVVVSLLGSLYTCVWFGY